MGIFLVQNIESRCRRNCLSSLWFKSTTYKSYYLLTCLHTYFDGYYRKLICTVVWAGNLSFSQLVQCKRLLWSVFSQNFAIIDQIILSFWVYVCWQKWHHPGFWHKVMPRCWA